MDVVTLAICTEGARPIGADVLASQDVPFGAFESAFNGGDVYEVGGAPILGQCTKETNDFCVRPASFGKCVANGKLLLELIDREGDHPRRYLFRWLVRCFSASQRRPMVCKVLDQVQSESGPDAVKRLLGAPTQGRGRPPEFARQMTALCALEQIAPRYRSWAAAAAALPKFFPAADLYSDMQSLQNLRSKLGPLPRLYAEGYFIPKSELLPLPWGAVRRKRTAYLVRSRIISEAPR